MKTQVMPHREIVAEADRSFVIKVAVAAAFSFFVCRAQLLGSMAPFGICFTAAMPLRYAWITALGNALGYASTGLENGQFVYFAALVSVILEKILLSRSKKMSQSPAVWSISVAFIFLCIHLVFHWMEHYSPVDLGLRVCESFIAGGVTCFCIIAVQAAMQLRSLRKYDHVELASTAILYLLALLSLMPIQILGFCLGIITAVATLLVAAEKLGAAGGAAAGVMLAIGINLYQTQFLPITVILAVSAFLSGLFRPVGRITQASVFLSVSIFSGFIIGMNLDMLFWLADVLIGGGIYFLIPKQLLAKLDFVQVKSMEEQTMKDNIGARLDFAAQTISDLQNTLEQVSLKLNELEISDIHLIENRAANYVCRNCGLNLFCWDEHYNSTVDTFQHQVKKLQEKGILKPEEWEEAGLNCCKKNLLTEQFNRYYQEYLTAESARKKLSEVRAIAVEQLSGISQMLWEVSDEISEMKENDPVSAHMAAEVFSELAVPPRHVFCTVNQFGRMEIDLYTLTGVEFDSKELQESLSHALKRDFAEPVISIVNNKVRISVFEQANLAVVSGFCQIPSNIEQSPSKNRLKQVCGDHCESFTDSKGNAYFLLSDGMGIGQSAAVDSTMTCSIVLKLIKAGFGLDSVIQFVNSSLQMKSSDETLSTIDLIKLDLYTGQAEFYKAGSAASFVRIDGSIQEISSSSLPVGILHGIKFDHKTLTMRAGDIILLLSDGILAAGEKRIIQDFHRYAGLPAQELSERICESVILSLEPGELHDDLTVMAIKITEGIS